MLRQFPQRRWCCPHHRLLHLPALQPQHSAAARPPQAAQPAAKAGPARCPAFYFGEFCELEKILPDCVNAAFGGYLTMTDATPWPGLDAATRALLPHKARPRQRCLRGWGG